MKKISLSKHLIRFADCDPLGHLNNGQFLTYFMNAREDHLRENYDLDLYEYTRRTGCGWMVIQNQIAYYKEAKLMEVVTISSRLIGLTEKTARVEMLMMDKDVKEIKCLLWADFIHFNNKEKKVIPIHGDHLTTFKKLLHPQNEHLFELRSQSLRKAHPSEIISEHI